MRPFSTSMRVPPAGAPARILCVGHVCVRKNQNAFIRALDSLAARHKFELRFLGVANENDAYWPEFLGLVRARPWCVYGGLANREELKALLRQATMLALPSLEDNCPMTVLEAMAAGVPVVAARLGGLPDLIEDGKTGFFCDPLDAASMAGRRREGAGRSFGRCGSGPAGQTLRAGAFPSRGHRPAAPRDLPGGFGSCLIGRLRRARLSGGCGTPR